MLRIGIDLGGTKIEGVGMGDDGEVIARRRVATPGGDYGATLDRIAALVASLEGDLGRRCTVGIGTPGALAPASRRLRNANSTCLNGRPLLHDLQALLECPLRIANDADCFALSEASDGAAAGARSVFGVIIGTGTGGGIVIDGHLLSGPNAIAGEWGHNPLPWPRPEELPGPPCYCGKHGCIETFLSGPGLQADYRNATTVTMDAAQIVAHAASGAGPALACMARYYDRMARALAGVINILDPEVIVLGGGLSQIQSLYTEIPARWQHYVFSDQVYTRLLPPRHGDASGVLGAARLWSRSEAADR